MASGFARRHDVTVEPIVTAERIDASPEVVIPAVIAALVIGVLGVAFRKTLMGVVDELVELWRTYAPIASLRALEHRPRMPGNPWFCDRCRSRNSASARLCYSCKARREEAESPLPESEAPAGANAGLSARTRGTGSRRRRVAQRTGGRRRTGRFRPRSARSPPRAPSPTSPGAPERRPLASRHRPRQARTEPVPGTAGGRPQQRLARGLGQAVRSRHGAPWSPEIVTRSSTSSRHGWLGS